MLLQDCAEEEEGEGEEGRGEGGAAVSNPNGSNQAATSSSSSSSSASSSLLLLGSELGSIATLPESEFANLESATASGLVQSLETDRVELLTQFIAGEYCSPVSTVRPQLFALNCSPSTVCPQLFALNCLPSTVRPQLFACLNCSRISYSQSSARSSG